ncbi:limonene-1,2-epoxide hydrolase family protein [Ilumatobacter sp.]|uniref:limonene-1,2-epoxide hydrolase family protein n=1 Tax=Ilumatobacter sp. TaxID=1967498 RepID=UPI003751080D
MTPEETVDAFIAALEHKDLDAAVALVSDDCEYDNVPMGKVRGRAEIRAILEPMITACATVEWIVHRQAAAGNLVINERLDRFEMPFGWIEMPVAGVFELDDNGKIALWRDYFDLATYRNQLPAS